MKCWIDVDDAKVQVKFYGSHKDLKVMLEDAAKKSLDKAIA